MSQGFLLDTNVLSELMRSTAAAPSPQPSPTRGEGVNTALRLAVLLTF